MPLVGCRPDRQHSMTPSPSTWKGYPGSQGPSRKIFVPILGGISLIGDGACVQEYGLLHPALPSQWLNIMLASGQEGLPEAPSTSHGQN